MVKSRLYAILLTLAALLFMPAALRAQEAEPTPPVAAPTAPATQPAPPRAANVLGPARLNSPQAAMFEFLTAVDEVKKGHDEYWPAALSTLDLKGMTEAEGKVVAEQLHTVLDQLGEVRPEDLPDPTSIEKSGILRFQYFPRVDVHGWVWKSLGGPPAGKIVLERVGGSNNGLWKFSARTCREMGALSASMAKLPPLYVPNDNLIVESITPTFQRTQLPAWLSLAAAVGLGLFVGKLMQWLFRGLGKRSAKHNSPLAAVVFKSIATPIFLLLTNVGLTVGASMIFLEQTLSFYIFTTIKLLWIINLAWLLYNLTEVLDLVLRRITARTESTLDDMLVPMVRKALRIFLILVFLLIVAKTIFGLDITGWLAGFGIAGLAVSLAAQDSIKNLFGSFTVFFDNPFVVGDRVVFGTYDCVIEEIGFRSTRVRTLEGSLVTIPNAKFIDGVVENVSARTSMRRQMAITISQKTSPEKAQEVVTAVKRVLSAPGARSAIDWEKLQPRVAATELAGDKFIIRVQYWYLLSDGRDLWSYQLHCQTVNMGLVAELAKVGVEFTVT